MSAEAPRYRRSPYLLVEWQGSDLVLTQCDSLRRFRVDARLLALLGRLDDWRAVADVEDDEPVGVEVLERLLEMGVVERIDGDTGRDARCGALWNPFDLAVQRHQNVGGERADHYRAGSPPPAFKPRPDGPATALPPARPVSAALDEVLSRRRSVRDYGTRPLTLAELSDLLHHSARVTGFVEDKHLGQQVLHPYPTGGARSELELYVVANDIEGLTPGAHWYDARAHDLVTVRPAGDGQDLVNRSVHEATGGLIRHPPAVLVVTAVFARVMWKYEAIALSLVARDVGCLYQTLYLVATALGLAPCAVGAGPELATARWLGLDPLVESQVGCFLVGTRQ